MCPRTKVDCRGEGVALGRPGMLEKLCRSSFPKPYNTCTALIEYVYSPYTILLQPLKYFYIPGGRVSINTLLFLSLSLSLSLPLSLSLFLALSLSLSRSLLL